MPFSSLPLGDGYKIPQLAFGSGSTNKSKDIHEAIGFAIDAGVYHLDTAQIYNNEESVGQAIKLSGLDRSKFFVTTKYGGEGSPKDALETSLRKLGLEYVDLYLIHFPGVSDDIRSTWEQLEEAQAKGLARSIGVSNFTVHNLRQLAGSRVKPVVNQIKLDPYTYAEQAPVIAYAAKHNTVIEAYSSLAPITKVPGGPVDAVVARLANDRKATPAQVIFLWVLAKGAVIVTTTTKRERLDEYLATANLVPLTPQEVAEIDAAGASKPTFLPETVLKPSAARVTAARAASFLVLSFLASMLLLLRYHC